MFEKGDEVAVLVQEDRFVGWGERRGWDDAGGMLVVRIRNIVRCVYEGSRGSVSTASMKTGPLGRSRRDSELKRCWAFAALGWSMRLLGPNGVWSH
jgi:hypothetical protein